MSKKTSRATRPYTSARAKHILLAENTVVVTYRDDHQDVFRHGNARGDLHKVLLGNVWQGPLIFMYLVRHKPRLPVLITCSRLGIPCSCEQL